VTERGEETGTPRSASRGDATPPWTILFIDDDSDFLTAQAAFFGARGHVVHTAQSGAEALDLLDRLAAGEERLPDLIFLDLMMEHVDTGFRLAHAIRGREGLADVPLVMLSGVARETGRRFDHEGDRLLAWSRLDRFLDKPVTGKRLLAVAQELLAGGETRRD
jgi:CheY-like chemotaxis protein